MKNISLIICLCLIFATQAVSQPFQGQYYYPVADDSTVLSSAWKTNNNVGYVMSGYKNHSGAPSQHFHITKVSGNGAFSNPATDFEAWYEIRDTNNCISLTTKRPTRFSGVAVIETSDLGSGEAYAITGAHSTGVFFATLDALGNVIQQYRWNFPHYSVYQHPKKPFIRESVANPGHYYICGDFEYEAYVLKVDATIAGTYSTPDWNFFYTNSRWMEAYALIESSYNSNELIVVGRTDMRAPNRRAADGFFLKLNANDGAVLTYTTYERMYGGDEWISAVDHAYSTYGGSDGFIIGGRSHYPPSPTPPFTFTTIPSNTEYTAWMAKLSQNGAVIWSTLIRPSTYVRGDLSTGDITSVFERLNTSGSYEYYGATDRLSVPAGGGFPTPINLLVFKLDDSGRAGTYNPDEFHYTDGAAPGSLQWLPSFSGAYLTKIDSGGANDGFQAFGTKNYNSFYFVKSYFNGYSGCHENIYNIDSIAQGPDSVSTELVENRPFNACGQDRFTILGPDYHYDDEQLLCSSSSLANGSNARQAVTGIKKESESLKSILLYPNPTSDRVQVSVQLNNSERMRSRVLSITGQVVDVPIINKRQAGLRETFELDFKNSHLAKGVYFLQLTDGTSSHQEKIFYSGNN